MCEHCIKNWGRKLKKKKKRVLDVIRVRNGTMNHNIYMKLVSKSDPS